MGAASPPRVGLLVTCLADLFRPSLGFASIALLEEAGCSVDVPEQTCCGQPAHNSGAQEHAAQVARRVIESFAPFEYVVVPSGSCASMVRNHYPRLFEDDPAWCARAQELAKKTFELTAFLVDVMGLTRVNASFQGTVAYHDGCHALRELGIQSQPRKLLQTVEGLTLCETESRDRCCGFGGVFCVKYSELSVDMASRKTADILAARPQMLVSGDLGCLLQLAGRLREEGSDLEVRHVAEVLAGRLEACPGIGSPRRDPH